MWGLEMIRWRWTSLLKAKRCIPFVIPEASQRLSGIQGRPHRIRPVSWVPALRCATAGMTTFDERPRQAFSIRSSTSTTSA
jgi:hypothetical protein